MKKSILVLSDNDFLLENFINIVSSFSSSFGRQFYFEYYHSQRNESIDSKAGIYENSKPILIKNEIKYIINKFDLIISLHFQQIIPKEIVFNVRCINVHPGLNPYNRGWYPQVFSIINGLPVGATIHEMDEHIDHGPIICQEEVVINSWDNSLSVYKKILLAEVRLLKTKLLDILLGKYKTTIVEDGNLNYRKDFNNLCKLDLEQEGTFGEHINILRALTHGQYSNAYFVDESGNKVYVKILLENEGPEYHT